MIRRPLALALALALLPVAGVHAEDLLQTYELARAGDPQLSIAESNRLITKEGAVQARAALLPQVGASASYNRSKSTGPGREQITTVDPVTGEPTFETITGNSETNSYSRRYGLNVDQVLFDFGAFSRLRSQRTLSRAADFTLESAGDSLVTRTSKAYFDVLVAIETLAAAEAQETALKKQFDFASKRLEVGLAPITDVHEARAQYDSARANTILVRNALADAYNALAEITGVPIRDLQALPDDFQPQLPAEGDADHWVATALAQNPALQAAELEARASDYAVENIRVNAIAPGWFPSEMTAEMWGDEASEGFVATHCPMGRPGREHDRTCRGPSRRSSAATTPRSSCRPSCSRGSPRSTGSAPGSPRSRCRAPAA